MWIFFLLSFNSFCQFACNDDEWHLYVWSMPMPNLCIDRIESNTFFNLLVFRIKARLRSTSKQASKQAFNMFIFAFTSWQTVLKGCFRINAMYDFEIHNQYVRVNHVTVFTVRLTLRHAYTTHIYLYHAV